MPAHQGALALALHEKGEHGVSQGHWLLTMWSRTCSQGYGYSCHVAIVRPTGLRLAGHPPQSLLQPRQVSAQTGALRSVSKARRRDAMCDIAMVWSRVRTAGPGLMMSSPSTRPESRSTRAQTPSRRHGHSQRHRPGRCPEHSKGRPHRQPHRRVGRERFLPAAAGRTHTR